MGKVPQVVTRKGGMPVPRTRLQHLVDSEVLLEKKRLSDTACLTSSRGRNRLFRTRERVSTRYRLPEPEGDSGLRYLLLATPCGDKQPFTTRTMCSSAVEVTPDRPHRTISHCDSLAFGRAGTVKPSNRGARDPESLPRSPGRKKWKPQPNPWNETHDTTKRGAHQYA